MSDGTVTYWLVVLARYSATDKLPRNRYRIICCLRLVLGTGSLRAYTISRANRFYVVDSLPCLNKNQLPGSPELNT